MSIYSIVVYSSVALLCPTLLLHGLQHNRPPNPSPIPGVYSNSCPLGRWCHPTILSSVVPFSSSIRVFSNESALPIRWPSIRVSASTSVLQMNIQDWYLGWTGWISLQSKGLSRAFTNTTVQSINSSPISFLYSPTLTSIHDYWKNCSLDYTTFVGKIMLLLFNMLSRLVIEFLPRSKSLLISWLRSPSAVILEPKKIKSATVPTVSPSICHEVMGPDAMIFVFWMLSFKPTFFTFLFHFHQEAP